MAAGATLHVHLLRQRIVATDGWCSTCLLPSMVTREALVHYGCPAAARHPHALPPRRPLRRLRPRRPPLPHRGARPAGSIRKARREALDG